MNKINFVKADISAKGNWSLNTINIKEDHTNAYEIGTLVVPVQTDENGRRYINRIYKVMSEPINAQYKSKGKAGADWSKCVKVKTMVESEPIYLKPNEVLGTLTYGNTSIHSKETKRSKNNAYKAFERISTLMLRSSL